MNRTLRRIYALFPSIEAWARSGVQSPLWPSREHARLAMREYFGPMASALFARSFHLHDEDISFVRSKEALEAMCAVVDAIYTQAPLLNGLFLEEQPHV